MSTTTPHDHLPLHPLEVRILLSLLGGPSYGTRIVDEIEAREPPRTKLYPANLYRAHQRSDVATPSRGDGQPTGR